MSWSVRTLNGVTGPNGEVKVTMEITAPADTVDQWTNVEDVRCQVESSMNAFHEVPDPAQFIRQARLLAVGILGGQI